MKRIRTISPVILCMIMLLSCNYRKTHVVNTIHRDGSVTRKVVVETNTQKFLEPKTFDVPIDNSWKKEITIDIDEKSNDTTWYLTAEKHFESVDEINEGYNNDLGENRAMNRKAGFSKRFRWFTTVFRFNETVEPIFNISCPISDFLTEEELDFFYLPEKIQVNLKDGPDSTRIKAISDSVEEKSEKWLWTCEIRQWTEIFYDLFEDDPRLEISRDQMKLNEPRFVRQFMEGDSADDLETAFQYAVGEEFFNTFESEINHAVTLLEELDKTFWSGHAYDLEIRMPGKLIASNGYARTEADSAIGEGILWTVTSGYFLTEEYEMWAESKVNNYYIWLITGLFILFVAIGMVLNGRKKS